MTEELLNECILTDLNTKSQYALYLICTANQLLIIIEQIKDGLYWKASLERVDVTRLISKIFESSKKIKYEDFCQIIHNELTKNGKKDVSFCSFNEVRYNNSKPSDENNDKPDLLLSENDIKKFLVIKDSKTGVSFPIEFKYFKNAPEKEMYEKTIERLKRSYELNNLMNNNDRTNLIKENNYLKSRIKILESQRSLGAVENDNFYSTYNVLYNEYSKILQENETLRQTQNQIASTLGFKEDKESNIENKKSKISEAEKKEGFFITGGSPKNAENFVNDDATTLDHNKTHRTECKVDVNKLISEIKTLKTNEQKLKDKIIELEKNLEATSSSAKKIPQINLSCYHSNNNVNVYNNYGKNNSNISNINNSSNNKYSYARGKYNYKNASPLKNFIFSKSKSSANMANEHSLDLKYKNKSGSPSFMQYNNFRKSRNSSPMAIKESSNIFGKNSSFKFKSNSNRNNYNYYNSSSLNKNKYSSRLKNDLPSLNSRNNNNNPYSLYSYGKTRNGLEGKQNFNYVKDKRTIIRIMKK